MRLTINKKQIFGLVTDCVEYYKKKKVNRVVRREKWGRASSDKKVREGLHEEATFELRPERLEGVIQVNNIERTFQHEGLGYSRAQK